MSLARSLYDLFVPSKTTRNVLVWSQLKQSFLLLQCLFLSSWLRAVLKADVSRRPSQVRVPDTSARPSTFWAYSTLLIWLAVWSVNVSICSVFQSIRSCRSLAARNEALPKLGYTYIAWHWVLCATWRKMKLIQRLSERERGKMPSRDFTPSGELLQNFFNILSLCMRFLPHPPTIKRK